MRCHPGGRHCAEFRYLVLLVLSKIISESYSSIRNGKLTSPERACKLPNYEKMKTLRSNNFKHPRNNQNWWRTKN